MRSKAHFKSHPIHPMLVAFPVAFLVAAPLLDLAGLLGGWPSAWTAGAYASVAVVVTGLTAAVPGLIDYLYVIPPDSSAKRRGTYHMLVNVTALALVAAGYYFRDWDTLKPQPLAVVLEFLGLGFMTVGGWLGGTLVYRNQIGVDHRYAKAGKWRETTAEGKPGEAVAIEGANELEVGQMMLVRTPDRRIVVARTDDGYVAFDDHCTHRGGTLAGGTLACGIVCCPWHGSQFNTRDGSVVAGPAKERIATHDVKESGKAVRLVLPTPNSEIRG
jgi:nitrite reductase/ring-hydroxylating ferredoxin subunit/uncharacterized membrane protein